MYMPGRLRTASRPSRTVIAEASYSTPLGGSGTPMGAGDSVFCSGVSSLTRTSSSGPEPRRWRGAWPGLTWIRPRAVQLAASTSMIALRRPHSTSPSPGVGCRRAKIAPTRHGNRSRSAERGAGRVPIRPESPRIGKSAPYVVRIVKPFSPVGVAWSAPVADRALAVLPRGSVWPEDLDHHDRAVAEVVVEAAYDGGREEPELRRPGCRVGADDELAVGERLRTAVRPDLVADQLGPAR